MPEYTGTCIIFADDLLQNGFISPKPIVYIEEYKVYEPDSDKAYINVYRKGKERARNLLGIFFNPRLQDIIIDEPV